MELQGVSLVVLSFFRDLGAATELANTVAAAGGIMGAAVCCAENGGDPNDDWTTCDRDRDMLLDRSPFDIFQTNMFPVTFLMQSKRCKAVHDEHPRIQVEFPCQCSNDLTLAVQLCEYQEQYLYASLEVCSGYGDTGTSDQRSGIARFTAAQFRLWHHMQAALVSAAMRSEKECLTSDGLHAPWLIGSSWCGWLLHKHLDQAVPQVAAMQPWAHSCYMWPSAMHLQLQLTRCTPPDSHGKNTN